MLTNTFKDVKQINGMAFENRLNNTINYSNTKYTQYPELQTRFPNVYWSPSEDSIEYETKR